MNGTFATNLPSVREADSMSASNSANLSEGTQTPQHGRRTECLPNESCRNWLQALAGFISAALVSAAESLLGHLGAVVLPLVYFLHCIEVIFGCVQWVRSTLQMARGV